jgi:hypothetical protein
MATMEAEPAILTKTRIKQAVAAYRRACGAINAAAASDPASHNRSG